MKKILFFLLIFILCVETYAHAENAAPLISISPDFIIQGDPIMVSVSSERVATKLTFDEKVFPLILYKGIQRAFIPIDINAKVGAHSVTVSFPDGSTEKKTIDIGARKKIEAPLGIPAKLGGNTPAAATSLVTTLSNENALLANLRTGTHAFWREPFRSPLASLTVTDPYGYNRKTGEYTIAHKGTDFRAVSGMKVMAMNRGVVRIARTFSVYGKTVVIDHGFGLQTLYMHLSKIYVNEGELILPGQVIGLSGMTGYAEVPHLHVSIKINSISIDPMQFMKFFEIQ